MFLDLGSRGSRPPRIGIVQVPPSRHLAANLEQADAYLGAARRRGADLVVFPECYLQGYTVQPDQIGRAVAQEAEALDRIAEIARRHATPIVAGFISGSEGGPHNSSVLISASGEILGVYNKTHLFGPEREVFRTGDDYPTFLVDLPKADIRLRIGMCICVDLEYPEVIRLLGLAGAELVTVSSANMDPYRLQQRVNVMSRAIENNLFVAVSNGVGVLDHSRLFGGSALAGPGGRYVGVGYDRCGLKVVSLCDDSDLFAAQPAPYAEGRRPETYRRLLDARHEDRKIR